MKEQLIQVFAEHPQAALLISLLVSIVIAVIGVLPSVFITAANIVFFGFWKGTAISFGGEALGAAVAFYLYRTGFKKMAAQGLQRFPGAQRLLEAEGKEAFLLILSLRLIPFVPSGLVTFAAAVGRVSPLLFVAASSLGKAPALLLEAYSVYQVAQFGWQGKIILAVVALGLLYFALKGRRKGKEKGGK